MFHTFPSPMTSPPCRIRRRNALVSSVYHNSPFFSGLVAALDNGLNRHNPCPCHSCQAIRRNKRQSVQHQDTPPSKRARTTSSSTSSFTSTQEPAIRYCQRCAFPDHPSRQICRECGRRRAPPAMVQHFHVERTPPPKPSVHSSTTDTDCTSLTDADTLPFVQDHLMPKSFTTFEDNRIDVPVSCDFNYPPRYQPHPLPDLHVSIPVSVPVQQLVQQVQCEELRCDSPRPILPDPVYFTDFESVCSPESRSMASKSINHVEKNTAPQNRQAYPNAAELDVDKLIEEVSNEISEQSNALREMDIARMSLVSSALSDVTSESVVALGGAGEAHEPSKAPDHQRALSDENAADIFLNEMIMSDDQTNTDACNDIADLSLTFLDGMFPSLNEQDVC